MTKKSEIFIRLQSTQPKYIGGNIKGLNGDKRNGNFTFRDSFRDVTQNTMTIKYIAMFRVSMSPLYFYILL